MISPECGHASSPPRRKRRRQHSHGRQHSNVMVISSSLIGALSSATLPLLFLVTFILSTTEAFSFPFGLTAASRRPSYYTRNQYYGILLFGELGSSSEGADGISDDHSMDDSSSPGGVTVSRDNDNNRILNDNVDDYDEKVYSKSNDFFFADFATMTNTSTTKVERSQSTKEKVVSVLDNFYDDDDGADDFPLKSASKAFDVNVTTTEIEIETVSSSTKNESDSVVATFDETALDSMILLPNLTSSNRTSTGTILSRRDVFKMGAISAMLLGGVVAKDILVPPPAPPPAKQVPKPPPLPKMPASSTSTATIATPKPITASKPKAATPQQKAKVVSQAGRIEAVNLTQVVKETNINITVDCGKGCLSVDSKNFTKTQAAKVPKWLPPFLTPSPKVVKIYQNQELLIASTLAGAATEMVRTSLLYPLQTVKTRIQTDPTNFTMRAPPIEKKIAKLGTNIQRYAKEGNLYAGITPTLIAAVPATGIYYGVRDVTKRMLYMTSMEDIVITLSAAFVADVVSLVFRTPADALALRLQAQNDDGGGDWFGDSLKRLPVVIAADLPYLLTKISLSRLFIHGSISIDQYTEFAIISAVVAALLTTPFDVARTRILVDSDGDFSNGKDGGSGESLFKTMKKLTQEGDGGIQNLFAGWLERVLYLGIGRAWLEPISLLGYVGIRDTVLLRWF